MEFFIDKIREHPLNTHIIRFMIHQFFGTEPVCLHSKNIAKEINTNLMVR